MKSTGAYRFALKTKTFSLFFAISVLGIVAGAAQAQAIQGTSFSEDDWELACDNTGTCRAAGYSDFGMSVLFTRPAGANQVVSGEFSLLNYDEEMLPPLVMQLWVGGKNYGNVEFINNPARLSAAQVQAILDAAKNGSSIVFQYPMMGDEIIPPGEYDDVMPTQGMQAVFSKMDEFQKRVGTTGAIIHKGNKAETHVLQPQPLPVLTIPAVLGEDDALAQFYINQKEKILTLTQATYAQECQIESEEGEETEWYIDPLNAQYALVSRRCWRGAYNVGMAYWLTNKTLGSMVLITTSGSEYGSGEIFASHKIRGLGDCWYTETHTWNGHHFILTQKATTGMCKGQAGGFWYLPTVVYEVVHTP